MPPVAHIRRAVEQDAEALAVLAEKTFRDTYTRFNTVANMQSHCAKSFGQSLQLAEIRNAGWETWVADADARLVAYAQLILDTQCPALASPSKRGIEILRFYVDSPYQGTGLARQLMDQLVERATVLGADTLWLGVWDQNPRAAAFYNKCQFDAVGDKTFTLGDEVQHDLLMCRRL